MNHTINEWQDMSLRKDVQQISKELQNRKSLEKPLLLEIYIGIISLIFDKFLDLVNSPKIKWIVLLVLFVSATLILLYSLWVLWKNRREQRNNIKREVVRIKPYVDIFDNNICYCALTASSFFTEYDEMRKGISTVQWHDDKTIFYYIECNYYINKCIAELDRMQGVAQDIFTNNPDGVIQQSKIHIIRLQNIVNLLSTIRSSLYNDFKYSSVANQKAMSETNKISKEYDSLMERTLSRISNSIDDTVPLVWMKATGESADCSSRRL